MKTIDSKHLEFDTKKEFKEYFDNAKKIWCCQEHNIPTSQFCNKHFQQFIRAVIIEELVK